MNSYNSIVLSEAIDFRQAIFSLTPKICTEKCLLTK